MSSAEVDFQVGLDHQEAPTDGDSNKLTCHFELRPRPDLGIESVVHVRTSICLVFDCSGSMEGEGIDAAVRAAKVIVEASREDNTISLVAFESRSHVLLAEVELTEFNREAIKRRIETLPQFVCGSTNMADGIRRGMQVVRQTKADAKVMILLSDGVANNPARAEAAAKTAAQEGIQVFAVGLGTSHGQERLRSLVAPSNGMVFGEQDACRLVETFSRLVVRIDRFIATNAYLELTFAPGVAPGGIERTRPERLALGIPRANSAGVIRVEVGNLERDRVYRFELPVIVPKRGARSPKLLHARFGYDVPSLSIRNRVQEATLLVHCRPDETPAKPLPPSAAPEPEKLYGVVLVDPGPDLISLYREIRDSTAVTLRHVRDRIRSVGSPIQEGLRWSEALAFKKRLEAVGARVEVRRQG